MILNPSYNAIHEVFNPLKTFNFSPQIISGEKEDVLPIDLQMYKEYEKEKFDSSMKLLMNSTVVLLVKIF